MRFSTILAPVRSRGGTHRRLSGFLLFSMALAAAGGLRHGTSRRYRCHLGKVGLLVLPFVLVAGASSGLAAEDDMDKTAERSEALLEEVIVTARRTQESLQDVPLTVNVVTSENLKDLNIRRLEDIQAVVPGLTLQEDVIAPNASLRGVRFDTFTGTSATVEFYLNDAPISPPGLMQALFDVGQIEVLRGPQGTLRGKSSPSGSITLTTQRPDLEAFGGYIDLTATNEGGSNANAALNVPILENKLALRVTGLFEENEGNQIKSINNNKSTETETEAFRISLRFEPLDTLSFNLMHQELNVDRVINFQVESANREDPNQPPPSQEAISPSDRRGVTDIPENARQELDKTVLEVAWELSDRYRLNYVGSLEDLLVIRKTPLDLGDFFGPGSDPSLQDFGQELFTEIDGGQSHELRLSANFDRINFIVGGLYTKAEPDSDLILPNPIFLVTDPPEGPLLTVFELPIVVFTKFIDKSFFGNVTLQLGEATELSVGLRSVELRADSKLDVGDGIFLVDTKTRDSDTVYNVSLKHNFSENLMAYVTAGSSLRFGPNVVGDFSTNQSEREKRFTSLPPETSESVELGVKSDWFDKRLRLNGTVFYQQFDNFPYRPVEGIFFVSTDANGAESVAQFNFVAPVPLDVWGVELEAVYQATERWNISALYSWAQGLIDDGTVPCNDYFPANGEPDGAGSPRPTVQQIRDRNDGENLAVCQADWRANFAPLWTATLQTQYNFPLVGLDAYVRGFATIFGDSKNDPINAIDDVDRYALLNLFLGLRDPGDKWEVMLFGKNIAETERVLRRDASPESVNFVVFPTNEGRTGESTYREIGITAPREFGVNFRYHF